MTADAVPGPESHYDAWRENCLQSVIPLGLETTAPSSFRMQRVDHFLGSATLQDLRFRSPHEVKRTPKLIRRSDPELYGVILVRAGAMGVEQAGNESVGHVGDLLLYDSSFPFTLHVAGVPDRTVVNILMVPKWLLPKRARRLKPLLGTRMHGSRGIGAVTAQSLAAAGGNVAGLAPETAARLGMTLADLSSTLISHHLVPEREPSLRLGSAEMLAAVERFIVRRLADPRLSPAMIASAHRISIRRLYQLFEQRETTIAAHIRLLRTQRVRRDLADEAYASVPIQTLARQWGFPNESVFGRAFRSHYGTTPSEYRRAVRAEGVAVITSAVITREASRPRARRS